MKTSIGEYIVGAYLKLIKGCGVVDYNVKPPGGGLEGLGELDVIGLDFETKTAYICEVVTHLGGINYGSYDETIKRIHKKHQRQKQYARKHLSQFPNRFFMLWSPRIPVGKLSDRLEKIVGLELIINETYTEKVDELREKARKSTADINNPFFRTLQILEYLRRMV